MEASYFGMNAIMFQNTQNVIVCGNDNDLSLLKDKVDFGLRKLWKGLAIPRLDKTWRSNQVRLGYKTPDGDDKIWSYIIIRNAKDGHNTEVAAGTTAKSFIMDEVGKYSFSSAFKAIITRSFAVSRSKIHCRFVRTRDLNSPYCIAGLLFLAKDSFVR